MGLGKPYSRFGQHDSFWKCHHYPRYLHTQRTFAVSWRNLSREVHYKLKWCSSLLALQYFFSKCHIRIVPRRFLKTRVAFCVIVKRKLHFNFMTHRVGHVFHDGVVWRHAKMKGKSTSWLCQRHAGGSPLLQVYVRPTCYCAELPIITTQQTLVVKYNRVFEEKGPQVACVIKIHISYQTVQLLGLLFVFAECLRKSLRLSRHNSWRTFERIFMKFNIV